MYIKLFFLHNHTLNATDQLSALPVKQMHLSNSWLDSKPVDSIERKGNNDIRSKQHQPVVL